MSWCQALPWRKRDLSSLRGKLDHVFFQEKELLQWFLVHKFSHLAPRGGRMMGRNGWEAQSVDRGADGSSGSRFRLNSSSLMRLILGQFPLSGDELPITARIRVITGQ